MSVTKVSLVLAVLFAASILATGDQAANFSAGDLFDIASSLINNGLTNFEPYDDVTPPIAPAPSTQFWLFSPRYNRFILLPGATPFPERSEVTGTVGTGTKLTLKRVAGSGFVNLTPDGKTLLGNGEALGGELSTTANLAWGTESTHQYAIRLLQPVGSSGTGILLQNRGNALCVSLDTRNKSPVIVQPCTATDDRQRWQLCQPVVGSANVCWPQNINANKAKREARRAALMNNDK